MGGSKISSQRIYMDCKKAGPLRMDMYSNKCQSHGAFDHVLAHSSMSVSRLEPELQEKIRASHPGVERVYFNKGL